MKGMMHTKDNTLQ